MASVDLLYETFDIYFKKAKSAHEKGDMFLAKRYYMLSAEQMLKIAKENKGELQKAQYKRAKSILELAESIVVEKKKQSSQELSGEITVQKNEKISLEEALKKLSELEGLDVVKNQVSSWVDQIKIFQLRKERGLTVPDMSYHMVFMGNPGTGKTTVARIVSQIYCDLGIVSEGQLVEVDRSDLVAGYVGQTAIKTQDVVKKAIGGVLFIDEAYTLNSKSGNDFGQEAIDTLLKLMEDNRSNLVVIVAGYNALMEEFISSNPGLRSRFKTFLNFSDYTGKELLNIFERMCEKNQYTLDLTAKDVLRKYFDKLYTSRSKNFGNARDVRNLFEEIITKQSKRVAAISDPSDSDITTILVDDLPLEAMHFNSSAEIKHDASHAYKAPEESILSSVETCEEYKFEWNALPNITFSDVAGLDAVKETVKIKVLLPLKNPTAFEGYEKKGGGGLLLYGPPGTGKTMIAAAIANEIGAKFCSVKPSDLIHQGLGQSEKAVKELFAQAKRHKCSVIYFDEMDSISPKNTRSQYAKQLRSELLAQMQGIESYKNDDVSILFLIAATNKPWDIDSAFIRPGRFGTRIYVGLPDFEARKYIIYKRIEKIKNKAIVKISDDIDINLIVERTEGYNCSDITNLMDRLEEISILRSLDTCEKYICMSDFDKALSEISSSVQREDIVKLTEWANTNI